MDLPCGRTLVMDDDVRLPGAPSVGSHGYAQCYALRLDGGKTTVLVHRLVLGLQPSDRLLGDHIDGNRLDCRRSNLRIVTPGESSANVAARAGSGFRGVYPNKGRWIARCKYQGKIHNLGTFDSPEEAAAVSHAWRLENLPGYVDRPAARMVPTG